MSHASWTPESRAELDPTRALYCVRDARDVLVANYRAWCPGASAESVGFGRFLRGLAPREEAPAEHRTFVRAYLADPVRYWVSHTTWADHLFTLRYEDLVHEPTSAIERLTTHLGLEPASLAPRGPRPREGVTGQWRSCFSGSDHDYFWSLAGERMRQLGYPMSAPRDARRPEDVEIPRICFLNLDRREDRARRMRASLDDAGATDGARRAAIDGRRYGSVDEILALAGMRMSDRFVESRADDSPRDPRFRAKAACWVSHFEAIADITTDHGWTVILEDDVRIDFSREVLVRRLSATVSDRPEVDMVVLSQRRGMANEGGRPGEGGRRGADAYAVRNASARKILALLRTEADDLEAFSPDGRFAQLDRTGRLCITSLSGGPWTTCLEVGPERDSDIRKARDGERAGGGLAPPTSTRTP